VSPRQDHSNNKKRHTEQQKPQQQTQQQKKQQQQQRQPQHHSMAQRLVTGWSGLPCTSCTVRSPTGKCWAAPAKPHTLSRSSSNSIVLAHQAPCSSQRSLLQVLSMHLLAQPANTRQQRSAAVQLQQQQHLPLLPLLLWLQLAWSGSWMRSWPTTQQTNSSSSSKCRNSSKSL
jgi:hypothetical protein